MKGMETKMLLGLILLLVVILIIIIIVFYPALDFSNTPQEKSNFEEFCVFWSLTGYNTQIQSVSVGGEEKDINDMCSIASSLDNCIKCCKKEIVC